MIRLAQGDDLPKIGLDTTGMAVTFDLGDPKAPAGDVHSRNKDQVAYRLALQAMHAAYAFQDGESVRNVDHPQYTPNPFELHFSGPAVRSATITSTSVQIKVEYGEGMYFNDTFGCEVWRGINLDNQPIVSFHPSPSSITRTLRM